MKRERNNPPKRLWFWRQCVFTTLAVLWLVCAYIGWPSRLVMPTPGAFAEAIQELFWDSALLWTDIAATLLRALAATALSTLVAVCVGVPIGASPRLWRAFEPAIDFFRAIPPLLVFPVLLMGFGYRDADAWIAVIVFGTLGTLLVHIASALARVPTARLQTIRIAKLRGYRLFTQFYFWEMLPGLLTGLRIAIAQALVIATATEFLEASGHVGIGVRARYALMNQRPDHLWVLIIVAGIVGILLSGVIAWTERRVNERVRA